MLLPSMSLDARHAHRARRRAMILFLRARERYFAYAAALLMRCFNPACARHERGAAYLRSRQQMLRAACARA